MGRFTFTERDMQIYPGGFVVYVRPVAGRRLTTLFVEYRRKEVWRAVLPPDECPEVWEVGRKLIFEINEQPRRGHLFAEKMEVRRLDEHLPGCGVAVGTLG